MFKIQQHAKELSRVSAKDVWVTILTCKTREEAEKIMERPYRSDGRKRLERIVQA